MRIKIEKQKRKSFALKIIQSDVKILMSEYLNENDGDVRKFIKEQLAEIDREVDFKFLRSLSKRDLLEISGKWQKILKVKPSRIQIREMKNKWSSCSSKGNITLSSKVALLPREIAEYVICHELLHLIVPNHGRTFKVLLSAYLPNWEDLHYKLVSYSALPRNIPAR